MEEIKKIDKRESVGVVTANELILLEDIAKLSLHERKLFYIAVAQCRMTDKDFYEYETSASELAEMWDQDPSNLYDSIHKASTELMKVVIEQKNGKNYKLRHIFEECDYSEGRLKFKLHKEMTDLLLGNNRSFSKPLMWDFMRMRSPYSIAIWHLMQKEMNSAKPYGVVQLEFELSLEELRRVTGTENKLTQVGAFKSRVLDKALREIKENALVAISYTNVKRGREIVGFRFLARSLFGPKNPEEMTLRERQQARYGQLVRAKANGSITAEEQEEYTRLSQILYQRNIEDYTELYGYYEDK